MQNTFKKFQKTYKMKIPSMLLHFYTKAVFLQNSFLNLQYPESNVWASYVDITLDVYKCS